MSAVALVTTYSLATLSESSRNYRKQIAAFIEVAMQRNTKTKCAQQKPSAMASELCRVAGKQRKEAQICFRVLLTKRVTYSDESGPQAAQVLHYCRRVPDTVPCYNWGINVI